MRRLAQLPPGDVFCADHQGGYLIWELYPRFRPYTDSRWVLRSADELEEYLGLSDAPPRFDAFQAQHRFSYVVLPTAYPDRYLNLIAHLYGSADWKLAYTDGSEVLFARADLLVGHGVDLSEREEIERIIAVSDARYPDLELRAAARVQLGRMLATVGELQQAQLALRGVEHPAVRALDARLRFAVGDDAAAERLARLALADANDDVRSLSLLARIALHRGQVGLSARFLKRALNSNPFDAEAAQLLAQLQESEK